MTVRETDGDGFYFYEICDECKRLVTGEKTYDGMCRECAIECIKNNADEFLEYL